MHNHFFDSFPIGALFVLTFLLMVFTLELGFQFGQRQKRKSVKAQTSQVRALMGATLGLLAFMLAFTFSGAQKNFESRMQLQIDEAILARNGFMQADLFSEPARTKARQLLSEFTEGRVKLIERVRDKQSEQVFRLLNRANEIHLELWSVGRETGKSEVAGFAQSVLGLMEMQTRRMHAALVTRIPLIIWLTLYFTAVMAMIVVGYQAGLTERRSPLATFSLALAFSAVMMLIMDLDRPLQSFFQLNVDVMRQLAEFIRLSL